MCARSDGVGQGCILCRRHADPQRQALRDHVTADRVCLLGDVSDAIGVSFIFYQNASFYGSFQGAHIGRDNILFADNHVEDFVGVKLEFQRITDIDAYPFNADLSD